MEVLSSISGSGSTEIYTGSVERKSRIIRRIVNYKDKNSLGNPAEKELSTPVDIKGFILHS